MTPGDQARVLFGVSRLLKFDRSGLNAFAPDADEARQSFLAAAYMIPVYVVLGLLEYTSLEDPGNGARFALVQFLIYIVSWTLWPAASFSIAESLNITRDWYRYVAAYNWMRVPILLLLLPLATLHGLGILPDHSFALFNMVLLGLSVSYMYILARWAFGLSTLPSILCVAGDLFLGMMISFLAFGLTGH